MKGLGRKALDRRGAAAVELVLILPVLLGLLAFAVDAGRMLADYHAVSKSVRDAARFLARAHPGAGSCIAGSLDRTQTDVARAVRLAMTGRIDGDPAREGLVAGWSATSLSEAATGISITLECAGNAGRALGGLYADRAAIPSVVVQARVPFSFGLGRFLGLSPGMVLDVAHKTPCTGV